MRTISRSCSSALVWACVALACAGCRARLETTECATRAVAGAQMSCPLRDARSYDLLVPEAAGPRPLLVVLHGGGGDRVGALKTTCPDGSLEHPGCLHRAALARGFVVAVPDGTSGALASVRTWNAGGGGGDWRCASGEACAQGVDDVGWLGALLDQVAAQTPIDARRIYVTGLSNGGAMSHRLGCELSRRVAAIAPVGGGMQLVVAAPCAPTRPVPVLYTHGDQDPCWRFEGGEPRCAGGWLGQPGKRHVSVAQTMEAWARINGCQGAPVEAPLPDAAQDGTRTVRVIYQGCAADTELWRVEGGGHTWPNGDAYLSERVIGRVARDWDHGLLLDWLLEHPLR